MKEMSKLDYNYIEYDAAALVIIEGIPTAFCYLAEMGYISDKIILNSYSYEHWAKNNNYIIDSLSKKVFMRAKDVFFEVEVMYEPGLKPQRAYFLKEGVIIGIVRLSG